MTIVKQECSYLDFDKTSSYCALAWHGNLHLHLHCWGISSSLCIADRQCWWQWWVCWTVVGCEVTDVS